MTRQRELSTPTERQAALNVGAVESVGPGRIGVSLELDAPQTTALNTGSPVAFPRLNSFVVIPNESGALVGIVVWLGVEHSSYPKRPGLQDFGLVDLPFPLRKMTLVPVGTLERCVIEEEHAFRLQRGVVTFPSVGDPVALPSRDQLDALTRGTPEDRRVHLGRALLGNDAEVRVDPDKVFGRHLAVLGNTGSGKSCSVAGLIRWSLEAAAAERARAGRTGPPNSRFIVLDPNGEFRDALSDLDGFQLFQVPPIETSGATPLRVPAWLLNSHEWASITYATPRAQRPVLTQALRTLRGGGSTEVGATERLAAIAAAYRNALNVVVNSGPEIWANDFGGKQNTGDLLMSLQQTLDAYVDEDEEAEAEWDPQMRELLDALSELEKTKGRYWPAFNEPQLSQFLHLIDELLEMLPVPSPGAVGNEDLPVRFDATVLSAQIGTVVSSGDFAEASRYVGGLQMRVKSLLGDERIRPILIPETEPLLKNWLTEYLGDGSESTVAVLDLSLVPSDVVEVVVAVLSRMIFESLQRHRRLTKRALPTTLVLEEAHAFVRHHREPDHEYTSPGQMCVRSFERIAREGRKFGLGLVLSSQRPSELSSTILAQCNTFLLHRLVNDRDRELVGRLVPDNLSGLLEDLPSLPSRHALLLGWAAAIPTLLEVRELSEEQRPQSADPDFWDVWTSVRMPEIKWSEIAEEWSAR